MSILCQYIYYNLLIFFSYVENVENRNEMKFIEFYK